ncbi:hypothetical protein CJF30_00004276 [Rutstroemia sp. NJR-2017a BBW]|nr:hypothetical protein CJF30_00004276 [Rutstroemia sp. NJR-2017a BBW]
MAVTDSEGVNTSTSPRQSVESLRSRAKTKTKQLLHLETSTASHEFNSTPDPDEVATKEVIDDLAFNPSKLTSKSTPKHTWKDEENSNVFQDVMHAIIHPRASAKSRTRKKTAAYMADNQHTLTRNEYLDFLDEHNELEDLEDDLHESDSEIAKLEKQEDIDQHKRNIEKIEKTINSIRVAWITGRHVERVRAVDHRPPPYPGDEYFETADEHGYTEFHWENWISHVSLTKVGPITMLPSASTSVHQQVVFQTKKSFHYCPSQECKLTGKQKVLVNCYNFTAQYIDDFDELPFDPTTLRKRVARLIAVSGSFQQWIMSVRQIYRWEDPYLMNWYYPSTVKALREEVERSSSREATAWKAGESMDKHGKYDWLGPVLDEIGPSLQLQIMDLANLMEVWSNFYHYVRPRQTFYTLCLLTVVALIAGLTSMEFSMKLFWLIVGVIYFGCWPVASLTPRYRLIVSPLRWGFWGIPTDAEWAMQYLQERAAAALEEIGRRPSTQAQLAKEAVEEPRDDSESFHSATEETPDVEERDILSFTCTYGHVPGRLVMSTTSLRFEPAALTKVIDAGTFNKPFSELVEMTKLQSHDDSADPLGATSAVKDKLELRFMGKEEGVHEYELRQNENTQVMLIENMKQRDKAFNAIIAFSGIQWQSLQSAKKRGDDDERRN